MQYGCERLVRQPQVTVAGGGRARTVCVQHRSALR
jgi:hypothetical protein